MSSIGRHRLDAYKVRSKILRNAEKLVETCDIVGDRYGIPVVNKRISVSPMATVCAGFTRDQMVEALAKDDVKTLEDFATLAESRMLGPAQYSETDPCDEA